MTKNNLRSIRFSDEIAEIIDSQVGDNFNQKFERLVYNCYISVEAKEQELKRLNYSIEIQQKEYYALRRKIQDLTIKHRDIEDLLTKYESLISSAINTLDKDL